MKSWEQNRGALHCYGTVAYTVKQLTQLKHEAVWKKKRKMEQHVLRKYNKIKLNHSVYEHL